MRALVCITTLALAVTNFCVHAANAEDESVVLEWKVTEDSHVKYETIDEIMGNQDKGFDLDKYMKSGRIDDVLRSSLKDKFEAYVSPQDNVDSTITVMEPEKNGNLLVKIVQNRVATITKEMLPEGFVGDDEQSKHIIDSLNSQRDETIGTAIIVATIDKHGKNKSFHLPKRQVMLVNLSFQLPFAPVQNQSHWDIDADCISINGQLKAKSSEKVNRVELNRVFSNTKGEQIAELDYLFLEKTFLDTEINDQLKEQFKGFGEDDSSAFTFPSYLSCSYIGRHQFNITTGQIVKTYGELTMDTGAQKSSQIMSMKATQLPLPEPKPRMSAEDRWNFLKTQNKQQSSSESVAQKSVVSDKLIPQKQTVALLNTPQEITAEQLKLIPKSPLPFLGSKSGVCFVAGTIESPSYEQAQALLKKTFGDDINNETGIIEGELLGSNDLKYPLKGTIDIIMLQTPETNTQTTELHVCSCVSCSLVEQEKLSEVQSISIKAVTPFTADRIYWLTGNNRKSWSGDEEDPLYRWRRLQEERERENKLKSEKQ